MTTSESKGDPLEDLARAAEVAARRDGRNAPALIRAAEAFLRAKRPVRAMEMARLAVLLDPETFLTQRGASAILSATGARKEGLAAAEHAVRLRPDDDRARAHLAALFLENGRAREAVEQFTRVLSGPAARPAIRRQLAHALLRAGETYRAIEVATEAVHLEPTDIEHRLTLASLLNAAGRYGDSLAVLDAGVELAPGAARVWRARSGVLEALGHLSKAIDDADRAISLEPDNPALLLHRSHLLASQQAREVAGAHRILMPHAGRKRANLRPTGLGSALMHRRNVVFGLIFREMQTRFGRSQFGYLWAIMEPIGHLATLGSVFSFFNTSPPPIGSNLFLYYITGLLPFLMFSHLAHELMHSRGAAGSIMQLPMVRTLDVLSARGILIFATEMTVMIIIFGSFGIFLGQGWPDDLLTLATAVLSLGLLAVGVGFCNCAIVEFWKSWDTIFSAIIRLLYFGSGIYYSPISMPDQIRAILVWNPILQGIEWFRAGFYRGYEPSWLEPGYLLACTAVLLLLGFALERAVRDSTRVVP